MSDLWVLPAEAGTVIAIGAWWLVRLEQWETSGSKAVSDGMERVGVKAQCVYSDDWVLAEAQQEGGYFVIAEPVRHPYGPTIRTQERRS